MDPRRILPIVILGEGALLIIACVAGWALGVPLTVGDVWGGLLGGCAVAAALAASNLWLLRSRGSRWPGDALRYVCRVIVRPLFEHVSPVQIVVVSMLAGLGEELLFRGVLQALIGLPAASAVFGAVHVGGRAFVGYGLWAACIGGVFGWLMVQSGGLLAPIVAHAVYDALALAYVRYGPSNACD
jgi:membrane protease YdiL (CAAX protease family)